LGKRAKEKYFRFIRERLPASKISSKLRVVVDAGNGAASGFVSVLFAEMGLNVMPLNDEPNGFFPGREPEPREDTLRGTVDFLRRQNADIAVCFDGDADRVVFCGHQGFFGFDEMIAFISRLMVKKTGKKVIATTVETGKLLDLAVKDIGGEVVRGKVGDVNVAYLTRELDAALGVEGVGVYIIPKAGYYPDSIFASLALLSQLKDITEIREFLKGLPELSLEKRKISCPNELRESLMAEIRGKAHLFEARDINTLDGIRLEFDDSWMLIRASGTEPAIRVIAESISQPTTKELVNKGIEVVQSCLKSQSAK
jgi:phosphomannomutase